ncbi:hypothetical protein J2W42_005459 [Rhizobium tibeticum]|nr:hypothetical protein [Rhizobium tibeticum]
MLKLSGAAAAAVPTIDLVEHSLKGCEVLEVEGILNATTNYLLDAMMTRGIGFDEALREAQIGGFAEADPRNDTEGWDTACKLLILANFGLGADLAMDDLTVEGIQSVSAERIDAWRGQGLVPKLVGRRAIVAQQGLGANLVEDAIYLLNLADSEGKPLDGASKYTMRFDKSSLPPVNAFWSITLYDEAGFQVGNVLERFAVSSWMPFVYNGDGYTLNQWEYLTRYAEDGRVPTDNNLSNAISESLPLAERVGCSATPWMEPRPEPLSTA